MNIASHTSRDFWIPGQLLRQGRGFVYHYGVVYPTASGWMIAEYVGKGNGGIPALTPIEVWVWQGPIEVIATPSTEMEQADILFRTTELLAKATRYDILSNNCEHFATSAFYGKQQSSQVRLLVGAISLGVLLRSLN